MSVEVFCYRLAKAQLSQNDKKWMPKWLEKYAVKAEKQANGRLIVSQESVLSFLVGLKQGATPAWQRLQAMRTLEWYQTLVLESSTVDFCEFRKGLLLMESRERQAKVTANGVSTEREVVPGEGSEGLINESDPVPVQNLRKRMRLLHYKRNTEETYLMWLERYIRFWDTEDLYSCDEPAGVGCNKSVGSALVESVWQDVDDATQNI